MDIIEINSHSDDSTNGNNSANQQNEENQCNNKRGNEDEIENTNKKSRKEFYGL